MAGLTTKRRYFHATDAKKMVYLVRLYKLMIKSFSIYGYGDANCLIYA